MGFYTILFKWSVVIPVSYTHLDVYKRQLVEYSVAASINSASNNFVCLRESFSDNHRQLSYLMNVMYLSSPLFDSPALQKVGKNLIVVYKDF